LSIQLDRFGAIDETTRVLGFLGTNEAGIS
jgi:hypothetical protein